jgi:DNA (cytosine-5)-methyltransferase 1
VNDLWATPREIFAALNAEFGFRLDVCATATNAKCMDFITEGENSLCLDWRIRAVGGMHISQPAWVWCNPPYSKIEPWVRKAAAESLNRRVGVVMLVMADTSVGWFADALQTVSEIRFITASPKENGARYDGGRIGFLDGDGKPAGGNNKGSMLLIWRPGISGKGSPVVRFESRAALQEHGAKFMEWRK